MTRTKKLLNRKARDNGESSIMALKDHGFKVERLTPFQFRINDQLDIYPTNKRWHDVIRKERGDYWQMTLIELCRRIFK